MRVLALNSSPRGNGQSKTEIMLNALVEGMREAEAEVDVVTLSQKSIKRCAGCFTCWTQTPGICIHQDDMTRELFPQWLKSDVVVYASPLYHYTVNSEMKAFIERTLPVLEPFFVPQDSRTVHPMRYQAPKVVLMSVAGFPEGSVFNLLSSWANFIFGDNGVHDNMLVAEIYRPMAEALTIPYLKEKAAQILDATRQAGREIVTSLKVAEDTMARVKQPLVDDSAAFLTLINLMWRTCIAEGIPPRDFANQGLMPRPDSILSFIEMMKFGFNPASAKELATTIQFNFSGENQGSCYVKIEDGSITGQEGIAKSANLTVNTPFEIWMDVITGKVDGQQMFMEQKYTVEGDLELLMRMSQLFGR